MSHDQKPHAGAPRRWRWDAFAAGLFAASGIMIAAWAAWPYLQLGDGPRVLGGRSSLPDGAQHIDTDMAVTVDADLVIPPESFRSFHDTSEVGVAMEALAARIVEGSAGVDGLRSLDAGSRADYARTVARIIEPYLTGDYEMYLRVAQQTDPAGADAADGAPRDRHTWERAVRFFHLAPVAVDHLESLPLSLEGRGRSMTDDMSRMLRMGMTRPSLQTLSIQPSLAPGWLADADRIETRLPLLLENPAGGRRLSMLGVTLARDPATAQWRLAETRIYTDRGNEFLYTGLSESELERRASRLPIIPPP